MIIPARIARMLTCFFPSRVWQIPTTQKMVYLTFDDGPHPSITPVVLDMLAAYGAKASFFSMGGNQAKKNTWQMSVRLPNVLNQGCSGHLMGG